MLNIAYLLFLLKYKRFIQNYLNTGSGSLTSPLLNYFKRNNFSIIKKQNKNKNTYFNLNIESHRSDIGGSTVVIERNLGTPF